MNRLSIAEDPNTGWAEVELWRWQYGELPAQNDTRELDIPTALNKMADAITKYCTTGKGSMPSPANVVSVLRFCATLENNQKM